MVHIYKNFLYVISLLSVTSFCGCGCSEQNIGGAQNNEDIENYDVKAYLTTTNRAYDLTEKYINFSDKDPMSPNTITLNPNVKYQEIDGFGAAITGSTSYNLSLMPEEKRNEFLEETFSPQKYGFSYVRISIGCSDFSLSDYTCCDTKGLENFALTIEETKYVIPTLKQILKINPDLKIMGTPWTCPKWMKVKSLEERVPYDSWTGGQLNPEYYQDYAQYFVKWIKAFNEAGVNIYSITPQNEPLNRGNSASLFMGWQEERDFVKTALGPALKAAGLNVKIYAFDHNYNYDNMAEQQKYPLKIYEDTEASKYFAGAAYHNYGGNKNELLNIHNSAPEKELVFSEASIGEWNDGRELDKSLLRDMEEITLGTVNNWCKASIVWNLMLDNDQGPHGGPGACATCYGAVDVDNESYSIVTRNSHYYIMAHMGSVVRSGAIRIKSDGYTREGLTYSAFENTDETYAFVVCNNNAEELNLTINDGNNNFAYIIPANSIVSFNWKK